jgi:hypothetical protein
MEACLNYKISQELWTQLVSELRTRGGGYRESGAFLLSRKESDEICEFICYDDLDSNALSGWAISFSSAGFLKLWEYLAIKDLKVAADVHTHPGSIVKQSSIDKRNPMISFKGHVAMILPHYALHTSDLSGVGIYEYQGNLRWKTCTKTGQRMSIKSNKS